MVACSVAQIGVDDSAILAELRKWAARQNRAAHKDDDVAAEPRHGDDGMVDPQAADPTARTFRYQGQGQVDDIGAGTGKRLVEDQDLRWNHYRARQLKKLPLPAHDLTGRL